MNKTRIINVRKNPELMRHPDYKYIGRGGKFGNPFSHIDAVTSFVKVENRDEAVDSHKKWLNGEIIVRTIVDEKEVVIDPPSREEIMTLDSKILGCFCFPLRCHASNYIDIIEEENKKFELKEKDLF